MRTARPRAARWLVAGLVGLVASGCSTLLPDSKQNPLGPLQGWGDQMLQTVR